MTEIKPKKGIPYISEELIRRYLRISPEDMYNSPKMRLSIDWETEQLQQDISAKTTSIYSLYSVISEHNCHVLRCYMSRDVLTLLGVQC